MITAPKTFEEAASLLTAATGALERLDITPDQLVRLRSQVARLKHIEWETDNGR